MASIGYSTHHSVQAPAEYPRDFPIIVHTLSDNVRIDHFTITTFISPDFNIDSSLPGDCKLRWLHIPANNMLWVEGFMKKWFNGLGSLKDDAWKHKLRPGLSQIATKPLHSRHMEPSCTSAQDKDATASRQPGSVQAIDLTDTLRLSKLQDHNVQPDNPVTNPLITLYIPYMNLDTYSQVCGLHSYYEASMKGLTPINTKSTDSNRRKMECYLSEFLKDDPPLHPRRTLDQFYYPSLNDTKGRDADQTISKWTGSGLGASGRPSAANDSLMIMVDQLWCWVLDDKTILSCFPSNDLQYHHDGFTDVYHSIRQSWTSSETVWHLYMNLVGEVTTYLFRQDNRKFLDLVESFRWVISKKVAEQAQCFERFSSSGSHSTTSHDRQELKLVLEVADIIDELKMIRSLVEKQREVLKSLILALRNFSPADPPAENTAVWIQVNDNSFEKSTVIINQNAQNSPDSAETIKLLAQGIKGATRETAVSIDEILLLLVSEIEILRNEAENTHKLLLNLLDLQQTAASLEEARSTTQQGRVIMLFTIITIIFLPLSFFTSYFGQNASEFTGDPKNPTSWDMWRYGTPISISVILSALAIAYYIVKPNSRLWFWRAPGNNSNV